MTKHIVPIPTCTYTVMINERVQLYNVETTPTDGIDTCQKNSASLRSRYTVIKARGTYVPSFLHQMDETDYKIYEYVEFGSKYRAPHFLRVVGGPRF